MTKQTKKPATVIVQGQTYSVPKPVAEEMNTLRRELTSTLWVIQELESGLQSFLKKRP